MKKLTKKGFTVAELVAVVAVLIMILLALSPVIIETINNTKTKSDEANVQLIIKAAETYYTSNRNQIYDGTTNFYQKLDLSGELPETGTVLIDEKGYVAVIFEINTICYTKEFSNQKLSVESMENISTCELK